MTRPYSNDFCGRAVRAHLDGEPIRSVASRYRATGSVASGRNRRPPFRGSWSRTVSGCTRWWRRRRT